MFLPNNMDEVQSPRPLPLNSKLFKYLHETNAIQGKVRLWPGAQCKENGAPRLWTRVFSPGMWLGQ